MHMTKNPILLLVLTVMTIFATGLATPAELIAGKESPAATAEKQQTAEEKGVRATAESFVTAFNRGDAKAIAALWTNDCEYVDETGRIFRGRDTIEKEYAAFFTAHPGLKVETSISSIKIIGAHAAIEDGTALVKNADGAPVSRGAYTAVHLKEGDKWLMASVREYASPSLSARPNFGDLEWLIGDWTAAKDSKTVDFSFKWVADKKFIELSYTVRDQGSVARSGIQIIGSDPASGDVVSWSFDSTGGYGQGIWTLLKKGLVIESRGMLLDGAATASTSIVSRIDGDSFTWQSVNRRVAGQSLSDAEPVVLKRKTR
jgi:uncharacterized protein (TIGR02246 family)